MAETAATDPAIPVPNPFPAPPPPAQPYPYPYPYPYRTTTGEILDASGGVLSRIASLNLQQVVVLMVFVLNVFGALVLGFVLWVGWRTHEKAGEASAETIALIMRSHSDEGEKTRALQSSEGDKNRAMFSAEGKVNREAVQVAIGENSKTVSTTMQAVLAELKDLRLTMDRLARKIGPDDPIEIPSRMPLRTAPMPRLVGIDDTILKNQVPLVAGSIVSSIADVPVANPR